MPRIAAPASTRQPTTAGRAAPPAPAATNTPPPAGAPPAATFDGAPGTASPIAPASPARRAPAEPLWKTPPPGVSVIANDTGRGNWVEKWKSPTTGKWVHNYTLKFIATRANQKFADNVHVGQQLPAIRKQLNADLKKDGTKEQLLALVVTLIDNAYFRVGNETSDDNGIFGVTTLQKRHVTVYRNRASFDYVGKKKVVQHRVMTDKVIARLLRRLKKNAPDDDARLFVVNGDKIDAADVNAYLDSFDVTAKQFRTFHSTRIVRQKLLALGDVPKGQRDAAVDAVFQDVAALLGHSPAVNRKSYTDPKVIQAFMKGRLR